MRRMVGACFLAVAVASTLSPAEGGRLPAAGVIHDGYFGVGKGLGCDGFRDLSFSGRMPAGPTAYSVTGSGSTDCFFDHLYGDTPSGRSFHWTCEGKTVHKKKIADNDLNDPLADFIGQDSAIGSGGTITYSGSCATTGFAGRFTLRMLLFLGQDEYWETGGQDSTQKYPVKGVYWVKGLGLS